jgi:hypothetical protein
MAKSGIQTRRQARTWLPEFNLHLAGSIEFHAGQLASRRQDAARRAEALELGRTDRAELLRLQLAASEAEATVITAGYQRMQAYAAVQRTLGR